MSLERVITQAWQKQATWLYLFTPLSWIYGAISFSRRSLYQKNILKSYRADVPVMIIGNITVGGSGKTPLIISLVKWLQKNGINVGVISRGYGGDTTQMPILVTETSIPSIVGDEPCLITQSTMYHGHCVPMSVCPNRQQAIELLINKHPDLQLIISDDGLQHYKLQRDIEWVVVDDSRGFGNKKLLPVGFLREPLSRLKTTTVITNLSTYQEDCLQQPRQQETCHLSMQFIADDIIALNDILTNKQKNLTYNTPTINDTVFAVSGIGYPQRFFDTLKSLGYHITPYPYPDHHDFILNDLMDIARTSEEKTVVITSKDAVKIRHLIDSLYSDLEENKQCITIIDNLLSRLFILPITAKLNYACINTLQNYLHNNFMSKH